MSILVFLVAAKPKGARTRQEVNDMVLLKMLLLLQEWARQQLTLNAMKTATTDTAVPRLPLKRLFKAFPKLLS